MIAAGADYSSEESNSASGESDTNDAETVIPTEILYGFETTCAPSHGSQILNTALAKAIEQYEDKETTKLVRNEYEMLDADEDEAAVARERDWSLAEEAARERRAAENMVDD